LKYASLLNKEMHKYDNILYNKFLFFYYNALIINYSTLDKNKALEVLSEAKKNEVIKDLPTFGVFIYLNTALIYFDIKKYKLSRKNITRLTLQKDFMSLDKTFQMKILIAELIIIYSTKQFDLLEEKIKSLKTRFKTTLANNIRDKKTIELINDLIYCNNIYVDKKINSKIEKLINMISDKESKDQDIISYNYWLKNIK